VALFIFVFLYSDSEDHVILFGTEFVKRLNYFEAIDV